MPHLHALRRRAVACRDPHLLLPAELKSGDPAVSGGHASEPPPPPYTGAVEPISKDDYFLKNGEFAAWLREARGKFFRQELAAEGGARAVLWH